jgi:hypothetical protein
MGGEHRQMRAGEVQKTLPGFSLTLETPLLE